MTTTQTQELGERSSLLSLAVAVVSPSGATREVIVDVADANVTVAAVLAALGAPAGSTLCVDGSDVAPSTLLGAAGVRQGSIVRIAVSTDGGSRGRCRPHRPAPLALAWLSGPDAGATDVLLPGRHLIGRGADADLTRFDGRVARWHATIAVGHDCSDGQRGDHGTVIVNALAPDGALLVDGRNVDVPTPLKIGSRVQVGACTGELRLPPRDEASASGGVHADRWTMSLHRPPRSRPQARTEPIALPSAAGARHGRFVGSLLPMLVSLAGGVVAAVVLRQPMLLALGAVGAVATLAGRLHQRVRRRRDERGAAGRLAIDIERFGRAVAAAHDQERARRTGLDDLVVALRRVEVSSAAIWARRPTDDDAYEVVVGRGDVRWCPPLVDGAVPSRGPAVSAILAARSTLFDVPITVRLAPGAVVGVVGSDSSTAALARSLVVQVAVAHGPADVRIVVATSPARTDAWAWTTWLPHGLGLTPVDRQVVVTNDAQLDRLLVEMAAGADPDHAPTTVLVLDDADLLNAVGGTARHAVSGRRGPLAAIVLVGAPEHLPAACTERLTIDAAGRACLADLRTGASVDDVAWAGCAPERARVAARRLARFHDPEEPRASSLPSSVSLGDLVAPHGFDGAELAAAWARLPADPPPRTAIGVSADGPFVVDLDRAGPHALVAGTTGSGKSELLRTLVAGLALANRPTDVTFVLVDYKGGSAFDACAALPHVCGLVTDLDDASADRALRSLEAELRHREAELRVHGASDLAAYRAIDGVPPLARLVVVIDEFAALAAELPTFLSALVGIAQRGRSLGVHLVLATQRPGNAVSDDIRANTNLRIALRVLDGAESSDVVGDNSAARIARSAPGRAVVRTGTDERVVIQSARCTGPGSATRTGVVGVRPFALASVAARAGEVVAGLGSPASVSVSTTELAGAVDAARQANELLGLPPPRRPWLDPLSAVIPLASLPPGMIALADDPDGQRQCPLGWDRRAGHLLLFGTVGSGTTTALATIALALAVEPAGRVHVYVIDMGVGDLAPLARMANVGAVVRASERERLRRLIAHLRNEVERRRDRGDRHGDGDGDGDGERVRDQRPDIVVLVDGIGTLRSLFDGPAGFTVLDELDQLVATGPEVGVTIAASADRVGAVPLSMASAIGQRWVFRLADQHDAALVGVRRPPASNAPPGRAVAQPSGLTVQLAWPGADLDAAVAALSRRSTRRSGSDRTAAAEARVSPAPIGTLPVFVAPSSLPAARLELDGSWTLAIGIADRDLQPAWLVVHPGDHVLVCGPARSGRTSTLALIAAAVAHADAVAHLVALTTRRSSLATDARFDQCFANVGELAAHIDELDAECAVAVFVDDADLIEDSGGLMARLLQRDKTRFVIAARPDALRAAYGHWTQLVRRSRLGLLLRPQLDLDGDLFGVGLPRRELVEPAPGRGYLVADGQHQLVQVACQSARTGG